MGIDPVTLTAIGAVLSGGSALLGVLDKDKPAAPPPVEPPTPLPDDEAMRKARRRSITSQMARRGRASTILTDQGTGDALGG